MIREDEEETVSNSRSMEFAYNYRDNIRHVHGTMFLLEFSNRI